MPVTGPATTLLAHAGASLAPAEASRAALVLIDVQEEYRNGRLPLVGVDAALDEIIRLVHRMRQLEVPVFHIRHLGRPGGALFDPDGSGSLIIPAAGPRGDEPVIPKALPDAFTGTDLAGRLRAAGRDQPVFAGFMTHMCVSTTTRAALHLGFSPTVVARGCATRDLPPAGGEAEPVPAELLHRATLAALADRFAAVVPDAGAWGG
ncbi:cysteine hydrolase family protein [Tistrella bauzanensis]|jgi:nicotinamidase-related amidase|uniref:Cysteine hydrolase family protein n=1 Tax=Tistrella arctica TaxID=3133430 RepID=A0ABU9YMC1_9PROT